MTSEVNNHNYSISEASRVTGLPVSTLRYYETIGIMHAVKRDGSGKNRIYNENDINTLVAIACLNNTGMSIDDMRVFLSNHGGGPSVADEQLTLLAKQKQRLLDEESLLKLRQEYIELKTGYWNAVADRNEKEEERYTLAARSLAKKLNKQEN